MAQFHLIIKHTQFSTFIAPIIGFEVTRLLQRTITGPMSHLSASEALFIQLLIFIVGTIPCDMATFATVITPLGRHTTTTSTTSSTSSTTEATPSSAITSIVIASISSSPITSIPTSSSTSSSTSTSTSSCCALYRWAIPSLLDHAIFDCDLLNVNTHCS